MTAGADPQARRRTLVTPPNLTLRLSRPVDLCGPWGLRRRAERLGVVLDDPAAVRRLLAEQR